MSDSDSDPGYHCDGEDTKYQNMIRTVKALNPSDDLLDRWCCIPVSTKKEAGERMKVCAFWFPILLQPEEPSNAGAWAVYIGLISHRGTEEFTMTELKRIEILEAILRALEKGSLERDQTKHLFHISNMLNMNAIEVFDKAMHWLERTEEPDIGRRIAEFGHINTCFATLQFVFTEFAKYIKEMGTNLEKTMEALMARPQEYIIEKSEEMKKRGNEHFQKQQFEDAVKFYSKAIKYYPDNHILYGNRALCYIRCKKYGKALADGKRATLIKPRWPKGHYRFCEALFMLGFVRYAIEANKAAQELCKDDHEGMKDLEQQFKLFTQTPDPKGGQLKNKTKRSGSANGADTVESHQSVKANFKSSLAANKAPQNKASEVKLNKLQVKNEQTTQAESSTKDSKPSKSDLSSKYGKGESGTGVKKKIKNTNCQSENQKVSDSKVAVCKELRSIVQDAHTALTDLRSRNAEQTFSQALSIVETNTPKDLGLSTVDVQLLLYGRASALTEIGQPEELVEAQKLLEKIKSFEERTFQCLVYYAIGRVYVKENRFTVALEQFSDSLQMVKNQITPGKLTWPLTKEIVKETQSEYLKEILERSIEFCKFPPIPDAICRLVKCLVPLKPEIYFTDPDFKGFIRIGCCQSCTVEYHIACWKTLKTSSFSEKSEKDFLQEPCLTPDCVGKICNIRIYGPTGLLKCKFEASIVRPETPKKPKVNQKCTSLKKLKSKEERRLKRKQHKLSNEDKQTISEDLLQKKEDSATQTQQKAWLIYRDRVLLQISQHMELLKEESGLHVSALITSLKPWLELDSSRGNRLAQRMLNWQQEALETLGQAVELLLERKSRVWACVFIQVLSSCVDVNPKLNTWACKLNDAGLDAAKSFIERYTDHLEQLDLTLLLTFGPLQEMMKEKLGTRPEVFSSISFTVTEYLKQAPPHDTRLFIWTLEEHRDEYLSCHTILDEYFDMMDGHCSVLKKSDESQNNSPLKTKNRGRKKKQKEPKGVIVLSGMRAVTPRDEWDQDFFEDDSLSFLHHAEPFTVPSHLRDQVADFEEQYNSTRNRSHYKNVLDNNPDPTKESLYDYFAQILEEHGPLVAEDPLLVGELENFPQVAQLKIQEAGGFESFLLDSLRFIKMGRRIGLAKHAVSLQQAGNGDNLDDLDVIVDPDANSESPNLEETAFTSYLNNISSAETDVYPILPNPYMYNFESASGVTPYVDVRPGINLYPHWSNGDNQQQDPNFLFPNYGNLDLYTCGFDGGDWQMDPSLGGTASLSTEENKRHAAVQTCQETGRNVAVNTELHERFESCQGDINKMEKNNHQLEQQIKNMVNGCDKVSLKHKEEITYLGEEIQTITANIQVTNKELALFQQKLEEEVKQDQKEKKANQEALKSLKLEIEKLVEEHGSLARNIREKKDQYEAKLADFLELGNQSAAEKMSLEDEIKRCKAVLNTATRRSHTAQLLVVESSRDQGLYSLYTELADAKALLSKLDEVAHRYPNQDLEIIKNTWRANVQEVEKKISIAETQYKEQIDQVKNGGRVSELIAVNMNNQSEPANAPLTVAAKEFTSQSSAQMSFKAPSPIQFSVAETPVIPAQPHPKPPTRTLEPPHGTVFNKAMERLTAIFPDTTRSDLMKFIQELRSSSGGSFASMSLQDVVGGVTQLILDHQDKLNSARSNIVGSRHPSQCATPPLVTPAPVWQLVGPQRTTHSKALNMEDPCIICHEDMSPDDICVLECRHSFHKECIRSWLKEQSTCPTCRDHALLPEDFPVLTGRKRQIP